MLPACHCRMIILYQGKFVLPLYFYHPIQSDLKEGFGIVTSLTLPVSLIYTVMNFTCVSMACTLVRIIGRLLCNRFTLSYSSMQLSQTINPTILHKCQNEYALRYGDITGVPETVPNKCAT